MPSYAERFAELVATSSHDQAEFFLKSFVFALGDDWKDVLTLCDAFVAYLMANAERHDLDPVEAAEFLQKQGKTRTALQRKAELQDIDLDMNERITFVCSVVASRRFALPLMLFVQTEFLLLHYKVMILKEYFKRHEMAPTVSLENEGVGLTGVGDMVN